MTSHSNIMKVVFKACRLFDGASINTGLIDRQFRILPVNIMSGKISMQLSKSDVASTPFMPGISKSLMIMSKGHDCHSGHPRLPIAVTTFEHIQRR